MRRLVIEQEDCLVTHRRTVFAYIIPFCVGKTKWLRTYRRIFIYKPHTMYEKQQFDNLFDKLL